MNVARQLSVSIGLFALHQTANTLPLIEKEGITPYCYGYGSAYGTPDKLMKDDMDRVEKYQVGQENVFLNRIDFYFEGKSYLNAFWVNEKM